MRNLIVISLLLFLQPFIILSQTKEDYVHVIDKYIRYYNKWEPDSLSYMLPDSLTHKQKIKWISALKEFKKSYGDITRTDYITLQTGPRQVALFKVVYASEDYVLGITHAENNKACIVPFDSNTPLTDSLLNRSARTAAPKTILYHTPRKEAKQVMLTGFIGMGIGATLLAGGVIDELTITANSQNTGTLSSQSQNNNNGHLATDLFISGSIVLIAGAAMAIGGGIAAKSKHRWTVIAPKANQVGLAYNLKMRNHADYFNLTR